MLRENQQLKEDIKVLENKITQEDYSASDVPTTAIARRGQGKFRKKLLVIYGSSCAFCGFDFEEFLIASHVVPHLMIP